MSSAPTNALPFRLALVVLTLIVGAAAFAAEALDVRQHSDLGAYLVDGEGMSLYLFLPDEMGPSTCYGDCASAWPPVRPPEGGMDAPAVSDDVRPGLIGAVERDDGSRQLTYGGWPLYTFVRDAEPGDVAGQGVGANWFLVSPAGEPVGATYEGEDASADGLGGVMTQGEDLYSTHCASCHGEDGTESGSGAQVLAGYGGLENGPRIARQALFGSEYMPAFYETLSDAEIAAVLTYVRGAWGNDFGPLTEEEVTTERKKFE